MQPCIARVTFCAYRIAFKDGSRSDFVCKLAQFFEKSRIKLSLITQQKGRIRCALFRFRKRRIRGECE
jgi:hypothetical protein